MSLVPCFVSRNSRFALTAVALATLAALAACGKKPDAAGAGGPPPTEVSVVTVAPQRLAISDELPGRLEATRIAEVRARVPGIILKRAFREGSDVKAGDVLFRIDPAPLQAAFSSAQAAQARAEATAAQATAKAKRYQPLVEVNAISKQEYDDAIATQKTAEADVLTARAARQTAALNLGYATVTAPISGRIGASSVTPGALVTVGQPTALATISTLNPIYVDIDQSSNELLALERQIKNGNASANSAPVSLKLDDGSVYAHPGKLQFTDVTVDPATGAVKLRALFPNPDGLLLPGLYVRATVTQGVDPHGILVPQSAIGHDPKGDPYVLTVDGQNIAKLTPVKTGRTIESSWQVLSGLKAGDKVIVDGLVKVQPDMPVAPQPAAAPAQK